MCRSLQFEQREAWSAPKRGVLGKLHVTLGQIGSCWTSFLSCTSKAVAGHFTSTTFAMSDTDDSRKGVPLLESASESGIPAPMPATKRKREDELQESKRAAKRKKSKKLGNVDDQALDVEIGVNHAIARMDSGLMADHVAQRTKRFRTEMSLVEAEDLHVPGMLE